MGAVIEMRDDDAFWAARRVMAFSDDAIADIVGTAAFADPRASELLARVLIQRRDRIGRTYLPRLTPVVAPRLDDAGRLSFANAAVDHKVATAPRRYTARWYTFDNTTQASTPIGDTSATTTHVEPPAGLPRGDGTFVRVDIAADHPDHRAWQRPVEAYFRRTGAAWTLVGLVRLPPGGEGRTVRR